MLGVRANGTAAAATIRSERIEGELGAAPTRPATREADTHANKQSSAEVGAPRSRRFSEVRTNDAQTFRESHTISRLREFVENARSMVDEMTPRSVQAGGALSMTGLRVLAGFGLLISLTVVAACQRNQPIYSVTNHPVPVAARELPADRIERAIVEAAHAQGWQVEPIVPGQLRAKQGWRTHMMAVQISFSRDTYNIQHAYSSNLRETGDSIHRNYNTKVRALEAEIEKRLYRAGY